jgi:hypothetical protein
MNAPAMNRALRRCFKRETLRWLKRQGLSAGANHVAPHEIKLMGRSGEVFLCARKRAEQIPALVGTGRRGRPSQSGHISLPTLRKYERELIEAGFYEVGTPSGRSSRMVFVLRRSGFSVSRALSGLGLGRERSTRWVFFQ